MAFVGVVAAVAAVWAILLGAAFVARIVLGLRRGMSLLVVIGCYLALAAAAVAIIGVGGRGLLGAAGMLVPLAVACLLALRRGPVP